MTEFLERTLVVVPLVGAVLLHVDVAAGAVPSGVAPTLPFHDVVGLALSVLVAIARTSLQGAMFPVPTWPRRLTLIKEMLLAI